MATNYKSQEFSGRGSTLLRLGGLVGAYDEEELAQEVIERARVRGECGVSTSASLASITALLKRKEDALGALAPGDACDTVRIQIQLLKRLAKVKVAPPRAAGGAGEVLDALGRTAPTGVLAAAAVVPAGHLLAPLPAAAPAARGAVRFAPTPLVLEHEGEEEEEGEEERKARKRSSKRRAAAPAAPPLAPGITCPVCGRALGGASEAAVAGHVERCLRRSPAQPAAPPVRAAKPPTAPDTLFSDEPEEGEEEGEVAGGGGRSGGRMRPERDGEESSSGASDTSPVERLGEGQRLKRRRTGGDEGRRDGKKGKGRALPPALRSAPSMADVLVGREEEGEEDVGGGGSEEEAEEEEGEEGAGAGAGLPSSRGRLTRAQRASYAVLDDSQEERYEERAAAFEEEHGDGHGAGDMPLPGGLAVPAFMATQLLPFQRDGVAWLWGLHRAGLGGILGDEMGLGKTVQAVALLGTLAASGLLRPTLIVCPATVISHWVRELTTWWPPLRVLVLHDSGDAFSAAGGRADKAATRRAVVQTVLASNAILITTYDAVRQHSELLTRPKWGYAILDEGHRIRNPEAAVTAAVKSLHTVHRIVLSGAPIQNRLQELWSLFDFVHPGRLGSLSMFEAQFTAPIAAGGWAHATVLQVSTAVQCALVLKDLITPGLLRRLKRDVATQLPTKTEQVLFCRLSSAQRALYTRYLRSQEVADVLDGGSLAFRPITVLRKVCNHPRLLQVGGGGGGRTSTLVSESGKMSVLAEIMRMWRGEKRRCLLFAQGTAMLDLLEEYVKSEGWPYLRMDGGTAIANRQVLVDAFNKDATWFVFLLTTRVGGVGVNLIGADRVVIFDPDWNPSTDTQARERAWRLGQRKHVTIYRLITAGTIEEKIYKRQVFKTVLTQRVLVDPTLKRQFSYADLRDLFTLVDEGAGAGAGAAGEQEQGKPYEEEQWDSDEEAKPSRPKRGRKRAVIDDEEEEEESPVSRPTELFGGAALDHLEAFHDPDADGGRGVPRSRGETGEEGEEDDFEEEGEVPAVPARYPAACTHPG